MITVNLTITEDTVLIIVLTNRLATQATVIIIKILILNTELVIIITELHRGMETLAMMQMLPMVLTVTTINSNSSKIMVKTIITNKLMQDMDKLLSWLQETPTNYSILQVLMDTSLKIRIKSISKRSLKSKEKKNLKGKENYKSRKRKNYRNKKRKKRNFKDKRKKKWKSLKKKRSKNNRFTTNSMIR